FSVGCGVPPAASVMRARAPVEATVTPGAKKKRLRKSAQVAGGDDNRDEVAMSQEPDGLFVRSGACPRDAAASGGAAAPKTAGGAPAARHAAGDPSTSGAAQHRAAPPKRSRETPRANCSWALLWRRARGCGEAVARGGRPPALAPEHTAPALRAGAPGDGDGTGAKGPSWPPRA
ncbi:unnamed protein product, partial [Prorocentrum cordatum]